MVRVVSLALTVCLLAVGCAQTVPELEPHQVWTSRGQVGSEANVPQSFEELAKGADLIVRGKLMSIRPGRDATEPGKPPNKGENYEIQVLDSVPDIGADVVTVEFVARSQDVIDDQGNRALPSTDFVIFLDKLSSADSGGKPIYVCSSPSLCVFDGTPPVAMFDEQASSKLRGGVPVSKKELISEAKRRRN